MALTRSMTSRYRMSRPKLTLDTQLYILDWIIAISKEDPNTNLSTFAGVSKTWQHVVERELFRSLTVMLQDLEMFNIYTEKRRHYVKHIVLEDWVPLVGDEIERRPVWFTEAIETLFQNLSTWDDGELTLEIGLVSSAEELDSETDSDTFSEHSGSELSREGLLCAHLPFLKSLEAAPKPIRGQDTEDMWESEATHLLGVVPVALAVDTSKAGRDGEAPLLPRVTCVAKLLIRRRYCSNINPQSFSIIVDSLPSLKALHIERWCYGIQIFDMLYDEKFQEAFELPPSVNDFSFYEECGTKFHQRYIGQGSMPPIPAMLPRSNSKLLTNLTAAADRVEHIAISFALDAHGFFAPGSQVEYKELKTLALTSEIMISRTDDSINALLCSAAEAAKMMPKLETLEIWYYRSGHAGTFTYQRLGRYNSSISWKCSWYFRMSKETEVAWRGVVSGEGAAFSVYHAALDSDQLSRLGAIYPHLALRERILHDMTWKDVAYDLDQLPDPDSLF